ncbi:hypothetical protein PIB30_012928 [Stylosanthes scabra]|uniref:Polysaccharide biosynthesis domain-containing protein n=1 Tax=Stylosanthes scabra TaxID=79078 RepID=A0ABU6Y5R9_9FABA|nr:hypothetical protein [Stylosanthes scabra]
MQPWLFNLYQPYNRRDARRRHPHSGNPNILPLLAAAFIAVSLVLLFFFHRTLLKSKNTCQQNDEPAFVPLTRNEALIADEFRSTASPLVSILHFATAHTVPPQSAEEIQKLVDVIQYLTPCNFLIFGIGHDSLMWDALNPRGNTLFVEENPRWTLSAMKRFPILNIHTVRYTTRISQADALLASYKAQCTVKQLKLKGNKNCPLALSQLPEEAYQRDWDMIMIDAPRGTADPSPGKMAVIYSVAVMARERKRPGVTHVFLHDVDGRVEQQYAQEFLCMKYRVGVVNKLWHFVIPPSFSSDDTARGFC